MKVTLGLAGVVFALGLLAAACGGGDEYEGWKTYTNEIHGYTLKYPGDCTGGKDAEPDPQAQTGQQFSGPLVDNERWPCLQVSHHDSEFYHPPAGTDVEQYIIDSGMPYDEIDTEFEVAGLPTVHVVEKGSPQAYDSDSYYFIKDDQLFQIQILHCGKEDWELYNKFLESFSFD